MARKDKEEEKKNKNKKKKKDAKDTTKKETTFQESLDQTNRLTEAARKYGDQFSTDYIPTDTFGRLAEGSTPEVKAFLEQLRQQMTTAGNYTGHENTSLDNLKAGLGGYTGAQLQAQREGAAQGINQDLMTQMRLAELSNARNRVRGAAATAGAQNLQQGAVQARGNMERDLFVKNADEVQRRGEAFSNIVNQTEAARFGRQQSANTMYGGTLTGEESYQNAINQYNIAQRQNEALARANLSLSGAGVFSGIFGGQQGNDIAQRNLDLVRQQNEINQKNNEAQLDYMRRMAAGRMSQTSTTAGTTTATQ